MLVVNARFLTQNITGVQRFAIELSKHLKIMLGDDVLFVCPQNIEQKELAQKLNVKIIGKNTGHLWEQMDLPYYLKQNKSPLLLNLCNTAPLFYKNKWVTIHDVAYERFPQSFDWKFRLLYKNLIPKIAKNSRHILTVSQFSKHEISNFYKIKKEKISVIHNAASVIFKQQKKESKENYILGVSSLNYQKNFHSLVKAFNQINDKKIKLYLVGGINKSFASVELLNDIAQNKNIVFKGRVSDEELIRLYSNAKIFVYPSLYEGFGIPPLEAQACACPVICSNVASLPEVGKESVLYCDPHSVADIQEKIESLLKDENMQKKIMEKGLENVKRFDWRKSAKKLIELVNENK